MATMYIDVTEVKFECTVMESKPTWHLLVLNLAQG